MSDHDHDHDHGHTHDGDHHEDHARPSLLARLRHGLEPHSHDAADSLDEALSGSVRGVRAVKVSLVVLGLTALLQLGVALASSSVALLADTVHNLSDALTALPLWLAFVIGRRLPTRRYSYGFGKAEDLAGLFVIAMIAVSAVVAGWEAVSRLVHPHPVEHLSWVVLAGVVGFAGNELVAIHRIRVGRSIGSAALVADGVHARTDGFTSLAVVAGALGVAAGWPLADPLVGLVITVVILAVLRTAARDVYRRLMDAVEPELLQVAELALASQPGVVSVRRVRMRWIGHELHADADLDVDTGSTLIEAHALAHAAEKRLTGAVPKLSGAVIHAQPAGSHLPADVG